MISLLASGALIGCDGDSDDTRECGEVSVAPADLVFSEPLLGETSSASIEIRNDSCAEWTLNRLSLEGSVRYRFGTIVADVVPSIIAAGGSLDIEMLYDGCEEAECTGALSINGGELSVPMSAAVMGPCIAASPSSLDFGNQPIDETHRLDVTLSSCGDENVTVNGIDFVETGADTAGDFSFTRDNLPEGSELAPGSSADIQVVWTPERTSLQGAVLRILSTDSDRSPLQIPVRGIAVAVGE